MRRSRSMSSAVVACMVVTAAVVIHLTTATNPAPTPIARVQALGYQVKLAGKGLTPALSPAQAWRDSQQPHAGVRLSGTRGGRSRLVLWGNSHTLTWLVYIHRQSSTWVVAIDADNGRWLGYGRLPNG